MGERMFKKSIKLILLSSIFYTKLSLHAFSMDPTANFAGWHPNQGRSQIKLRDHTLLYNKNGGVRQIDHLKIKCETCNEEITKHLDPYSKSLSSGKLWWDENIDVTCQKWENNNNEVKATNKTTVTMFTSGVNKYNISTRNNIGSFFTNTSLDLNPVKRNINPNIKFNYCQICNKNYRYGPSCTYTCSSCELK